MGLNSQKEKIYTQRQTKSFMYLHHLMDQILAIILIIYNVYNISLNVFTLKRQVEETVSISLFFFTFFNSFIDSLWSSHDAFQFHLSSWSHLSLPSHLPSVLVISPSKQNKTYKKNQKSNQTKT